MWGAWCKTLVGGFSLGEWEPLCPRPTLPEAACNTAGGLGGAVSPPTGSGRERILAIMYIKFAQIMSLGCRHSPIDDRPWYRRTR